MWFKLPFLEEDELCDELCLLELVEDFDELRLEDIFFSVEKIDFSVKYNTPQTKELRDVAHQGWKVG